MKPVIGQLCIEGYEPSRAFRWHIYIGKNYTLTGRLTPFKREQTARNDAIRIARRLNIKLVEQV
jgi:hypothetical protein